ncbi:MAG: hypothetical protein Q8P34_06000 [Bacteroidota bacterium]|nr:hypothetical protein [Bacteroidota bacterium]
MKTITKLIQITLLSVFFYSIGYARPPAIENRRWILEKFRDPQTKKEVYADEYHYLEFRNGHVSFSIDCNNCSKSYEFISRDSINFSGNELCTRKGCMEKDVIRVSYSGTYKIWIEGGYLIIRTKSWDHIYK